MSVEVKFVYDGYWSREDGKIAVHVIYYLDGGKIGAKTFEFAAATTLNDINTAVRTYAHTLYNNKINVDALNLDQYVGNSYTETI